MSGRAINAINAKITSKPAWMVGGSGLGIGQSPAIKRWIQILADGQEVYYAIHIFRVNQLGGIGGGYKNSMFGPTADGARTGFRGRIVGKVWGTNKIDLPVEKAPQNCIHQRMQLLWRQQLNQYHLLYLSSIPNIFSAIVIYYQSRRRATSSNLEPKSTHQNMHKWLCQYCLRHTWLNRHSTGVFHATAGTFYNMANWKVAPCNPVRAPTNTIPHVARPSII